MISLDGKMDETLWQRVEPVTEFSFPWEDKRAPLTEFRCFTTNDHFYFLFRVVDSDLVVIEDFQQPEDVTKGDRVEIFFSQDPELENYYSLEIDPQGRAFDYQGSFYREFDNTWRFDQLETAGRITVDGYIVEGRIPLDTLRQLKLIDSAGKSSLIGLYRGEFSNNEGGPPREEWISWVDPETDSPDFHVPSSFGCFYFD